MSRPLSSLVIILVEGDVDSPARRIGKLRQMSGAQIGADGAGGIAKAGLPQDGEIEQTFDQDHRGEVPNRVPGEQAAFGARGKSRCGNAVPILRPYRLTIWPSGSQQGKITRRQKVSRPCGVIRPTCSR